MNVDFCSVILEKSRRLQKRDKLIALSFAALVVLLGSSLMVKGVSGVYHDDGIYLITAKAMAQGNGYRLINLPDSPIQTKYPFLYPAILAVVWKVFPSFPANLAFMQWVSLLSGAAAIAIAYIFLIRFEYFPRVVTASAILLCATSPHFLFFCTSCLSEIPFALSLIIAMWALDKHNEGPYTKNVFQVLTGCCLALPLLFRIIGVVSVPVIILFALWHRKAMKWLILGAAMVTLPFAIWLAAVSKGAAASPNIAYYTDYVSWWSAFSIPHLGQVLYSNAIDMFYGFTPVSLIRWFPVPTWLMLGAALIGLFVFSVIAGQVRLKKSLPIYLVAYLAVVLVWPWPPSRFLVPVLPFLFAYSISAVINAFKKFPLVCRIAGPVVLGVLLAINAYSVSSDITAGRASHYPGYMLQRQGTMRWSSYEQMFDWIKQNTNPDNVFASGMDPMLYLYADRRAFRPFAARPSSMFYGDLVPALGPLSEIVSNIELYKTRYLVLSPMPGFSEEIPYIQFIQDAQKRYPGWLEIVYQGADKRFAIWKVNPALSPAGRK
jgi:hypothetical protein